MALTLPGRTSLQQTALLTKLYNNNIEYLSIAITILFRSRYSKYWDRHEWICGTGLCIFDGFISAVIWEERRAWDHSSHIFTQPNSDYSIKKTRMCGWHAVTVDRTWGPNIYFWLCCDKDKQHKLEMSRNCSGFRVGRNSATADKVCPVPVKKKHRANSSPRP
jgi:hypothetical protein